MAAAASWKRRQMPAVRTRSKTRNDWRTYDVVLYAVPAANLIPLRGTRSVLLATTDPKVLYDEETFAHGPTRVRKDDARQAGRERARAASRRLLYGGNPRARRVQAGDSRWQRGGARACGFQNAAACGKIWTRSVRARDYRR